MGGNRGLGIKEASIHHSVEFGCRCAIEVFDAPGDCSLGACGKFGHIVAANSFSVDGFHHHARFWIDQPHGRVANEAVAQLVVIGVVVFSEAEDVADAAIVAIIVAGEDIFSHIPIEHAVIADICHARCRNKSDNATARVEIEVFSARQFVGIPASKLAGGCVEEWVIVVVEAIVDVGHRQETIVSPRHGVGVPHVVSP